MLFRENVNISRQRLELLYSVFLLIVIPLLIAANTLFTLRAIRSDLDTELRKKADLANQVLGAAIKDDLSGAYDEQGDAQAIPSIQRIIEDLRLLEDDIEAINIVVPNNATYSTVASSDENLIGVTAQQLQYTLVAEQNQSIAQLVSSSQNAAQRVWRVASPVTDNGNVIAISEMDVSLKDADALVSSTLTRSFVMLIATLAITVLLLANHFRFVQYAHLFRKLKEIDQLKSDFLNVATHELKAPMAIIEGGLSNVIDGLLGDIPDKARDHLVDTRDQTKRLSGLVEDLLNVSRIEQGKMTFKIEAFDPQDIINMILRRYADKAERKGIALEYDNANATTLMADPSRYQEIMTNLIDNALKYSTEGTVTVSHKISDNMLISSVRDTGLGMSTEERKKLFTRFYRAKNDRTKDISGTGLGLWIIKQYIENMNGSISVDSLENVGTEFQVSLPLAEPPTPK